MTVRSTASHLGFGRLHRAGPFAAAGLVALETMVERLPEDHRRARRLAELLAIVDGLEVDLATVQTNIVNIRLTGADPDAFAFAECLAGLGVGLLPLSGGRLRAVVHRGIDDDAIASALPLIATARV